MSDEETLKVYADKVDDYAKLVTRGTPDRDLQDFIDGIPAGGRVLDLGCGPGNSAAMMIQAGLLAEATDASPEMVNLAKKAGVPAWVSTFEDVVADGVYDGIWANFSLLHAPKIDMPANLARIANALRPGGFFHLGTKTGTGEKRDRIGRFYAYYTEDELRGLLGDAGFEVGYVRHGEAAGLDGTDAPFIIMKARLK
jgi:2-polyprenyl-3-methyl-5-hydroxy-6-metoxy-1,4-benzoquinol methylase